ncbi:MAG: ubiquinone biosynthesis protein UbiA [Ignavibacteria bacterium]|nr:MAG: ubiquinone biosynthesis protein UbiA [Ignavibacteria bacterium]
MTRHSGLVFARAYVKSMRLYYSFITGIAGMVGWTYYQYVAYSPDTIALSQLRRTVEVPTSPMSALLILVILFLAWGINQIFNDYLGLEEDRINAPQRPMVTGELHPRAAVVLSSVLMLGAILVTWFFLERAAVIPLLIGVALNIVYEYAKGHGIWGNIIFGIMISSCSAFGFMAAGPSEASVLTPSRMTMLGFIALINGVMTFYTYFKDYEGDKASGKNTIIVRYGLQRSRFFSIVGSFLPSLVFIIGYLSLDLWPIALNGVFVLLGGLTIVLQLWTGYLFYRNPVCEMTYYSLSFNFRACACAEATLIALFNPTLGILLFFLTYMLIGFLFNFHINRHG